MFNVRMVGILPWNMFMLLPPETMLLIRDIDVILGEVSCQQAAQWGRFNASEEWAVAIPQPIEELHVIPPSLEIFARGWHYD